MYKPDLALNNLQWLICHKPKQNKTSESEMIPIFLKYPVFIQSESECTVRGCDGDYNLLMIIIVFETKFLTSATLQLITLIGFIFRRHVYRT